MNACPQTSPNARVRPERHEHFAGGYTSMLLEHAAEVDAKTTLVHKMWPGILRKIIRETIHGIDEMESLMRETGLSTKVT